MSPSISASKEWRKAILPKGARIQQAIRSLNESSCQIALVVLPDGTLQGTLTDGDIRRGLLRGLDLNSAIDTIIQREPLVVPPELSRDTVLQLMQANRVHQVPVVDGSRRVVGLHLWAELMEPPQRANLMIIMAGGEGTRLRPHTEHCPKPLLPLGDKPMLEHIIELARAEGFVRFVLAIHYLGHMIEEYFGDGSRWQVQITYLRESSPLGTAGALGLLQARPELPFVVTNGDVITDIHYGKLLDFHIRHEATATMAVRVHEWQHPFGVVQTQGVDIVGFEEKPVARSHINAGVYALDPEALSVLSPESYCDMPVLFERLREKAKRTVAYPMHEPWLDVGRPDDLSRAIAESSKTLKDEPRKV
ncbi:MAG: nucleotidyltransferase family protein [Nitrospira sp. BO4]|jgi:dTDP-glucose pyrophosphorylase|nr:nucleotidyltransferase family protein [Nitrospira sp. BO4]